MTLHEAIKIILEEKGTEMTTIQIADELNKRKLYSKKDNSLVTDYQIHGRTKNYPQIFIRNGSKVSLIKE
ncbi:MAG: hypothetical protein JEZ03_18390 [Bacteroidales bacterium]|nr:hypothetical protein [Bacteroidales bacterium]